MSSTRALALLLAASCGGEPAPGFLTLAARLTGDVAQVRFVVLDQALLPAGERTVPAETESYPAEAVWGGGHGFADANVTLPPGVYSVQAFPETSSGGASLDCQPGTGAVSVTEGQTQSLLMTIPCRPTNTTVSITSTVPSPPEVTGLFAWPSFWPLACETVTFSLLYSEPVGGVAFSVVDEPHSDYVFTPNSPFPYQATLVANSGGTFQIRAEISGAVQSDYIIFPVYVQAGGCP